MIEREDWKIGDIIVCVDNSGYSGQITIGKKYVIMSFNLGVRVMDDLEVDFGFNRSRFKNLRYERNCLIDEILI